MQIAFGISLWRQLIVICEIGENGDKVVCSLLGAEEDGNKEERSRSAGGIDSEPIR